MNVRFRFWSSKSLSVYATATVCCYSNSVDTELSNNKDG